MTIWDLLQFSSANLISGNFPVILIVVGFLNSYAVSYADTIAVTVQRAFLGASRLQNYIPCPACSEILARIRNSIGPVVPHRLSVRKAIGQSVFRARVLIFEFLLRKYKIYFDSKASSLPAGDQNRRKENLLPTLK